MGDVLEPIYALLGDSDDRVMLGGVSPGDTLDSADWIPTKGGWFARPQPLPTVAGAEMELSAHVRDGVVDVVRLVVRWASARDRYADRTDARPTHGERWTIVDLPRRAGDKVTSEYARGYFRVAVTEQFTFGAIGQHPSVACRYQLTKSSERFPTLAERQQSHRGDELEALLDRIVADEPVPKRKR